MKNVSRAGLLLITFLIPCLGQGQTTIQEPVVTLGPEINVSAAAKLDPQLNEYQTDLRCDPLDPLQMCITCKVGTHENEIMALISTDGGQTWNASPILNRSGDPDNLYTLDGHPVWSLIDHALHSLDCRLTCDGGSTWSENQVVDRADVDHPQMVCDRTQSHYRGTIYIAGRPGTNGYDVVRSRDEGKTFQKTSVTVTGPLGKGFVYAPAILKDGSLLIPITSGGGLLSKNGLYDGKIDDIYCLRSHDGGITFDPPIHITPWNSPAKSGFGGADELGGLGVGTWNGGQRVYLTFAQEFSGFPATLMLTTSDDGGSTWTPPRAIAPSIPTDWGAGSSSIMVNAGGVVGIQFYSLGNHENFDIYFTSSTDGGITFSTPVRISSATSHQPEDEPRWAGQDQVYGDVSADGNFQLVWTDSRQNAAVYQIYHRTAQVK